MCVSSIYLQIHPLSRSQLEIDVIIWPFERNLIDNVRYISISNYDVTLSPWSPWKKCTRRTGSKSVCLRRIETCQGTFKPNFTIFLTDGEHF